MRKLITTSLLPLAPALCLFGPLIIAFAIDGPLHIWAVTGVLTTGFGSMILFLKVMEQSRQIDELSGKLQER